MSLAIKLALLASAALLANPTFAEIPGDGKCKVFGFCPFASAQGFGNAQVVGVSGNNETSVGFSQLAAFLLAAQHFNDRNAKVVPEIDDLGNCTITIDLNNSQIFDSMPFSHASIRSLYLASKDPIQQQTPLCGMVGPFDDYSAPEVAVLAQSSEIPIVVTRSANLRVVSAIFNTFSSTMFPDTTDNAQKLVEFLIWKGRYNYVGLLYDLTDTNLQRREAIAIEFDTHHIQWTSFPFETVSSESAQAAERTHYAAMERAKASGYKTIVICMADPWTGYQRIADAAEALGMLDGTYFFVWYDVFDTSIFRAGNANVTKFTVGSAWIMPQELHFVNGDKDPFLQSWRSQGPEFVEQVNEMNPKQPGEVGYLKADDSYFQRVDPEYGAAFMYDATMSVAIGACNAQKMVQSPQYQNVFGTEEEATTISGSQHQVGVRSVQFYGATGQVEFGDAGFLRGGTRRHGTAHWAAVNNLPAPQYLAFPDILDPNSETSGWQELTPFIYADGSTEPPKLLRETPQQNYISDGLRAIGYSLTAVAVASALVSALFVFVRRKHRVLAASQPEFLYLICFGALVQSTSIILSGYDESSGWSESQLSAACMAKPWLLGLGYIIVYCALFTKLWRVNKVLQFGRTTITIWGVVWPMAVLVLLAVVVLTLWTVISPLRWERNEINDETGESIGSCSSDGLVAFFLVPFTIILLIPTASTAVLAHKTRDVDPSYSEAFWILLLIVLQFQIMIVGIPLQVLLKNESAHGRYVGLLLLQWFLPMSTISLVVVPKIVAYHRAVNGKDLEPKRGQQLGVRVTGVNHHLHQPTEQHPTTTAEDEPRSREQTEFASTRVWERANTTQMELHRSGSEPVG